MSYQVLARKYRPQRFSEVIGQEHVTRTLKNAIEQQRIAHGYIFSGHRGIGKTTVARILAMALNCRSSENPVPEPCGVCDSCTEIRAGNSVDVMEIDAATNRGIDEIRELREGARYRPARDRFKIYILDEAHQITDAAFNALLKTLEEPPSHVVFMLATTQPEDIPQTIRSRCQHFSFHAVKFEEILGQLKDLAARENIPADEDALALLAEAGDGSMRDALSILDQAIASREGQLTADSVRQLVGAAPSTVMEDLMQAVARNSSEEALRLVDRLLNEGQSPVHFARQMARFLRNTTVAKVAGADSSLLQISGDERQRVARIAELFSEEDLARHLQIMLRTHGELGYRQEQRFLLELGILKMVHAQRLLPIEQLLSEAGAQRQQSSSPSSPSQSAGQSRKPSLAGESSRPATSPSSHHPSPFSSDSARKGVGKPQLSSEGLGTGPRLVSTPASGVGVVMGAAVAVDTAPDSDDARSLISSAPAEPVIAAHVEPQSAPYPATTSISQTEPEPVSLADIQIAVLNALSGAPTLAHMLQSGEWKFEGNELAIKVSASATVIEMSLGPDAKRLAVAAASNAAGRNVKLKVVSGGATVQPTSAPRPSSNGNGRSRAEQEPVIKRMQEKFGAEIRTIIDYRTKR